MICFKRRTLEEKISDPADWMSAIGKIDFALAPGIQYTMAGSNMEVVHGATHYNKGRRPLVCLSWQDLGA